MQAVVGERWVKVKIRADYFEVFLFLVLKRGRFAADGRSFQGVQGWRLFNRLAFLMRKETTKLAALMGEADESQPLGASQAMV
jgi:hypothetical protein